jgi:hypothetical protein
MGKESKRNIPEVCKTEHNYRMISARSTKNIEQDVHMLSVMLTVRVRSLGQ